MLGLGLGLNKPRMHRRRYFNLIHNGNFANGKTGWGTIDGLVWSVLNNEAIITNLGSSTSGFKLYQLYNAGIIDRKYYLRAEMMSNSSNDGIAFAGIAKTFHSGSGNYEALSMLWTATFTAIEPRALQTNRTGDISANPIKIKNVIAIDLTATFGAGNEPALEWCDANIPQNIVWT